MAGCARRCARRGFCDTYSLVLCRESEESIDDESVDFRRQAGAARSVYSSQPMNRPISGNDKVQRKEDICFRS
uniref:Apple domain-containing protein n=1 Tax=Ascaris lumbricoides TaxID=6252 RepID=A0A0M3I0F1_ASCLU